MNCIEKRHAGHKASMQHLCYLDSFMDETDREVMSLTDRAFKSLCIGDEAIYNDSEFSPPLVSCYKPLAEEVPKKTQESCSFTVKKHETHPLNGVNDMPWHINKNSSLFTAFAAKKNGDTTKMLNGDSWDKSALLSIQRELSEFSSDYQNSIADKHGFQVKNHLKSSEKSNKSSKDTSSQSGKSSKSKHSKSSKLRKLNSRNFFLHSELSPFQSWRDLNKFPFGLENIEIFQSNGPPEWYDSPLYKKLTMSHSLHVPGSNKEVERQNTSVPALEDKPEAEITQHTANAVTSIPLKPEKHSESETHTKSQIVLASSGSEQRCQSEGDHSAPWRKNRSRAKSVVPPVGQSLMSSLSCEKTKAVDEDALPIKKEVRTMEEQGSTSSTPFNILQLLTPVIPSRQGTGSSEVLRAVLSPSTLDLPLLPEREKRPSPEIKREGYKSIASSLLFNLKDNRKRVKTMYSPPKFKGLEPADQNKLSPLIEQVLTKDGQEVAEIPDAEITSAVHQKAPASLPPEAAGQQKYTPSGHINGGLPDDFLALSLLQPLKSNKSPVVNKATYPSLNLYRKASPGESDTKTMQPTLSVPGSHPGTKHGQNTGHPEMQGKDLQRKPTPALNLNKPTDHPNSDGTLMNVDTTKRTAGNVQTESADAVTLKEKYPLAFLKKHSTKSDAPTLSGSRNLDNLGETGTAEQRPVKDKGRMEAKPKHLFSARQNNYIKSQRYVSVDDEECGHGGEEVASAQGRTEVEKGNSGDELSRISESANVREERKGKPNVGLQKVKEVVDGKMEDAPIRESVENAASNIKDNFVPSKNVLGVSKGDGFSMKGNTSAKRALFAAKEQVHTKAAVALKKENQAMDKYELAKAALEEVIAERNQRKKQSQNLADDQDLVTQQQDDYKQANQSQSSQKDTLEAATKDRRGGRKGFSDLKSSSRIVQSMSERDTKHGESHVAEVNLARPCKQEGAAEHGQRAAGQMKYRERDRSGKHGQQLETDNVKALDKVTGRKEREPAPTNISLTKESSRVSNIESRLTRQGEEDSALEKKGSAFKPEVPPRRGRASSQSDQRSVYEIERKEDGSNKSGKHEQSVSSEVMKGRSQDRGPVRGHVSALKEKFNKEQGLKNKSVHEFLAQGEGIKDSPKKDKIKPKDTLQKVSESTPAIETASRNHNPEGTAMNSGKEPDRYSKLPKRQVEESARKDNDAQDTQLIKSVSVNRRNDEKRVIRESTCASEALEVLDNQNRSKDCGTNPVKEIWRDIFEKSHAEQANPSCASLKETTAKTSESLTADNGPVESVTVYDILNQPEFSSPVTLKQVEQGNLLSNPSNESSLSHKLDEGEGDLTSPTRTCDETLEKTSGPGLSERLGSPPSDVDKGGWVRCLMETARNLTPTSRSSASTPTMGKPALFKVKDNTFRASPITKTVRPVLHKTVPEITQLWSPRESWSGSERGEEDHFKYCVEVQSPTILSPTPPLTPARSPQSDQSSMHLLSPLGFQFTTSRDRKGQLDCLTVPEEEEMRSAVSSVSEGIESCGTSAGDTVEETTFIPLPTEDAEESRAPSERSGSACSGLESQSQSKPPAVPPKTEKALRRAMKLTTRRIQKADSKSKSERKGRSSEKNTSHKPERRHHSSDKVHSGRSEHRAHSIDLGCTKQSPRENDKDTLLLKTHRRERLAREYSNQESHYEETPRLDSHANQNSTQAEPKNFSRNQRHIEKEDQLEARNGETHSERTGRPSGRYLPEKLDRRAQSLDRFLTEKPELVKRPPLRQNSVERTYASNIVTQSFPMTQRKLLQDPDSGQYFVVDMPVQVKTKTFFDPETGSYVQLPVQSPEASVPQAQSMEVVKAPPLVLYHGFVPMPVSTLPAQKSTIRLGSVVTPDDLELFESGEMERHDAIYQKPNPYPEPMHVSQEHLAGVEIDSVR